MDFLTNIAYYETNQALLDELLAEVIAEAKPQDVDDPATVFASLLYGFGKEPDKAAVIAALACMRLGEAKSKLCCEFHDKDPELMPLCGPDDQGGYCCDDCPTLVRDSAVAQ